MKKGTIGKIVVRSSCAALAAGFLGITTGCDQGNVLALVRTTAENAVVGKAEAVIQDTVNGIIGGVLPDASGT